MFVCVCVLHIPVSQTDSCRMLLFILVFDLYIIRVCAFCMYQREWWILVSCRPTLWGVFVCIMSRFADMFQFTHTHTCRCIHIHITNTCNHFCGHVSIHIHTHTCPRIHVHIKKTYHHYTSYIRMHAYTLTYVRAPLQKLYKYVYIYTHTWMCIHTCTHTDSHAYTHTFTYTYTHIRTGINT